MSREQVSVSELLLSLDSSELQEAERVRATVNQQLSTDRGGVVLSSLVEYYLDSSSSQAALLLSSIREPHHKVLLEKLNESLNRAGTRLAAVTLLGHLIRKQPPWVHHISQSALLSSLLRCLKTDGDVVVLVTGVLVLITLLPMIPQAGKQHIYDFFDVFGRLASWSFRNPGHVSVVFLVHLHAGVYSLFHRLYGMFPCNFISYLRLHYSMKENLDTFQEVVKPMLEHVRVHPELVTGTQDNELDPSRWRRHEVHDIVIECSKLSLDPLESSCELDIYSSSSPRPPSVSFPIPYLDLSSAPCDSEAVSSTGSSVCGHLHPLTLSTSNIQTDDVTWSPSSQCGLSTPPPEPAAVGSTPSLSRCSSVSGVKCPSPASNLVAPPTEDNRQVKQQPVRVQEENDVINNNLSSEDIKPPPYSSSSSSSSQHLLLTSTPNCDDSSSSLPHPACSSSLRLTPPDLASHRSEEGGPAHSDSGPTPTYDSLFELALPRAATLFVGKKTQHLLGEQKEEQEEKEEEELTSVSPLKVLDQMIVHGNDAHERLSSRLSLATKMVDRSHFGGKQQSMKSKGPAQGEELQALRSQLLLVHGQLQYERFKRQQHAVRNRRLLRRVINATALEEHSVAMKAQLSVQDGEIRCLKLSLDEEQRRYGELKQDTQTQTEQLHAQIRQLQQQQQERQQENQKLQSELQECHGRLRDLEAELQKANHKAYNAEHQLTQLSLKLCSSEQLQQQIFLLNQQLVLLRETNRALREQLDAGDEHSWTEKAMLQCTVGKDVQRLKDRDVQQRQKLEAANHRITELENQLAKKEKLIVDQKKLLEDSKNQSREELLASESRCVALRRVTQSLQTEMLHLYSQVQVDTQTGSDTHVLPPVPQDVSSRPIGDSASSPGPPGSSNPLYSSSSAVGIINGTVETLSSCSPLSVSPIDSPLAVGSFLEQQARRLFGPTSPSPEEAEQEEKEEEEEEEKEEEEEAQSESPPLGQEVEEATLLAGSPHLQPLSPPPAAAAAIADLSLAVRQRRDELSIMNYDELLPEF
ncbi:TSC complex subunit 1a isoform X2 [Kryptolebias marmoratus]|uniref:TSC complex subunit 1a isoform X2 n=1 Tax=Kryptolebias marmoratus TaxID=37003 RepID=UPI0007F87E95|nr:TSC complex subunit 1a isoform X2 [Kryptolebias marmoratus]